MIKIEKLLQELCPNGVEIKKLHEIVDLYYGKGNTIPKDGGQFPVYGCKGIVGTTSTYNNENTALVGHIGSAGEIVWAEGKHFVTYNATICKPKNDLVESKYIYYFLTTKNLKQFVKGSQPFLSTSDFCDIDVPVPPLVAQREIVQVLDKFTLLTAELTAELTARRQQYEYYRDNLLTFETPKVETLKLEEIAQVYDGTHQTPEYQDHGIKFVSVENIDNLYDTNKYISEEAYKSYKIKPQPNDVLMTRIGSIGKCAVVDRNEPLAYYVSLALLRPNLAVVNAKFLKYVIESGIGSRELAKRTLTHAVPIKINKNDIGKIVLPIPSLEVQERIVRVLDNFDAICSDLQIGLPAEIEARQKQYEFYRDKLLTFAEKK